MRLEEMKPGAGKHAERAENPIQEDHRPARRLLKHRQCNVSIQPLILTPRKPPSGTGRSRFLMQQRHSETELQLQAPCTPGFPRPQCQLLESVVRPGVQFRLRKQAPSPEPRQRW